MTAGVPPSAPSVQDGVRRSFCRCCLNKCAIKVTVENGRAVRIAGDAEDPLYGGYTCVKGRAQPGFLNDPGRLLHSLKRMEDGSFAPIPVEVAMDEIAEKLMAIRDRHGPRAIASYRGTMMVASNGADETSRALLSLLGTQMSFDTITIDKGGKQIAAALFGRWMAPAQGFDAPDAVMVIGANPLMTYTGFPAGNPNWWLKENLERGMKLLVIDPRRMKLASKADVHLQPAPGHDPEILASLIHVVLSEELYDKDFVAENVDGIDVLRSVVGAFAPGVVAARAGVSTGDIIAAARIFAAARRGFIWCGTGPSMSATGTLTEYLALVLDTLCGHWLREGEIVQNAPVLLPRRAYKAQASPPVPWTDGEQMRVRSLMRTVVGVPTGAMADEILLEGEGQVRAMLCWNGNPALAVPDHGKITAALRSLDLLVQVDARMSETARLADYVIASKMPLEVAGSTILLDYATSAPAGYGLSHAYANHTPAIVRPPAESELTEEWLFFKGVYERVARKMAERGDTVPPEPPVMRARDTEEMLDIISEGSRISLGEVRDLGHGAFYPDEKARVGARDEGWQGRFDCQNPEIMSMLRNIAATSAAVAGDSETDFPFRLICRRENHMYNSSYNSPETNRGRPFNPAYMHPDDLAELKLAAGDLVLISSSGGSLVAVAGADPELRRGLVSIAYATGGPPETDDLGDTPGGSVNRLTVDNVVYDPYYGHPRMSNVPINVTRMENNNRI